MQYIRVNPRSTRLGNWMFQYAAAKTFAKGGAVAFVIEESLDISPVENYHSVFPDLTIVRQVPKGTDVLQGLFQDVKYLDRQIVKDLFRIRNNYHNKVEPGMVSIHVRRGDYLKLPHRHPFVGEKYLREAVARFPKGTQFMIFSDDVPWCKKFFKGDQYHFSPGKSAIDDLFLMSWCDHHICSNSTFSWWGAYLRFGGRTIFPSMWYGPAIKDEDCRGLYFEGSEVVKSGYTLRRWLMAQWMMAKTFIGDCLRNMGLR